MTLAASTETPPKLCRLPSFLLTSNLSRTSERASTTEMASFLRGKQAGMQNDLSAGILPQSFAPGEQSRYGVNSQIRQANAVQRKASRADRSAAVLPTSRSNLSWLSGQTNPSLAPARSMSSGRAESRSSSSPNAAGRSKLYTSARTGSSALTSEERSRYGT